MENKLKKVHITPDYVIMVYLIVYFIIMLFYSVAIRPGMQGEWDDYALPTISLINEHNFSISPSDVAKAKEIYSDWAGSIDHYRLSPYHTRAGGEMAFYFPTYSAACVPLTLLLYNMKLPAVYAFPLTNLAVIMIMSLVIWKCLKAGGWRKLALIVLLTANPVVFYFVWPSAETFIFALIGIALVFWHNHSWKRAAFFLSIAGSLNPTVMAMGFFMILDYFHTVLRDPANGKNVKERFLHTLKNSILFACCFVICLIPMAYNYYNVGAINLTASMPGITTIGGNSTPQRFLAYLFDLNFGMLPYYWIIFIMAIVLIPFAVIKKQWRYLMCIVAGCCTIMGYSIMGHINHGMSGIARYNAWGSVMMIFAVCIYADKIFDGKISKLVVKSLLAVSAVITSIIVYNYGPMAASNTLYFKMTPIAEWFLNKAPALYNPLYSTFNSRISHVDGGYSYETPIAYVNDDFKLKKVLAAPKDKDILVSTYYGSDKANAWLKQQAEALIKVSYISVPSDISLEKKIGKLESGKPVLFYGDDYNASQYVRKGVSHKEEGFSWTDGHEVELKGHLDGSAGSYVKCTIRWTGVYNGTQHAAINANGKTVYDDQLQPNSQITFKFKPDSDIIDLKISLPDAVSPAKLGQSGDTRVLGMQLTKIVFEKN